MQVVTEDPTVPEPDGNPLVSRPSPVSKLPQGECMKLFAPMDAALKVELPREQQSTLHNAYTRACRFTFIKEQQVFVQFDYPDMESMLQGRYLDGQPIKRSTGYEIMPLARLPASWVEEAGDRVTIRNALEISKGDRLPVLWVLRLAWEGLLAGCKLSGARRIAAVVAEAIADVDKGQPVPSEEAFRQRIEQARLGTPEDQVDEAAESLDDTLRKVLRDSERLSAALEAVSTQYRQEVLSPLLARRSAVVQALAKILGDARPLVSEDPKVTAQAPPASPESGQTTPENAGPQSPESGQNASPESGQESRRTYARPSPGVSVSFLPLLAALRALLPGNRDMLVIGLARVVAGQPSAKVEVFLHDIYEDLLRSGVPRELADAWMSLLTDGEREERGRFALWIAKKIGAVSLRFYLAKLQLEDLPPGLREQVQALLSDDSSCAGWSAESRKRPDGQTAPS